MKFIREFYRIKIRLFWVLVIILLLAVLSFVMFLKGASLTIFGQEVTASKETQVVKAMKKQKEVAVLALSVTDIYSQTEMNKFLNFKIPFTEKTSYVQGTFDAKLGFDGNDVTIKKKNNEENIYSITIPEFVIIGVSNPEFKEVTTSGEIFSFGTDIDTNKMQNKALSDKTLKKYIEPNKEWLEDQTKEYYNSIIDSIDSDAKLDFTFS